MERRFSIEAKAFWFSILNGSSLFRLEERRKHFVGFILVSSKCAAWLIATVESACLVEEDIAKSFREGNKAVMVHGGSNKSGRFLEVAVFAEGGRKGGIWIPEGRDGRGWRLFAGELRVFLDSLDGGSEKKGFHPASNSLSVPIKVAEVGVTGVGPKERTFAEVLQANPRSLADLKDVGADQRWAEDSTGSERMRPSMVKMAGAGKGWVNEVLGFFHLGLGRIVIGLLEGLLAGPKELSFRKRVRATIKGLKGFIKGYGAGPSGPTSVGHRDGVRRLKMGHRGVGLGRFSKPKRVRRFKPQRVRPLVTETTSPALGPVPSTQVAAEDFFGASIGESPALERVLGGSPLLDGDLEPAFEGCLGASDVGRPVGGGSSGAAQTSPVSSLLVTVVASDDGRPAEEGSSLGVVLSKDPEPAGEGPSVSEPPAHAVGSVLPVAENRLGVAVEGSAASVEPTPLAVIPAFSLTHGMGVVSGAIVDVSLGENSEKGGGLQQLSQVRSPAVIPAEESDLSLTVAAPPDASDGSSQMSGTGFSVPFAEEFLEFLPAGSLGKDWEDFYSSWHTDRLGMSDAELIKEAFALPWEVDEPASPSCRDKEASSSGAEGGTQTPVPMRSLLRRGFLGPRIVSPHPVVLKEVVPVFKGKDTSTAVEASSTSGPVIFPSLLEDKQGVHSTAAVVLPSSQVCQSSNRTLVMEPNPINSSVSLSQMWYNRRVKEKVARQLNKNKELIAEAVGVLPVGGGDRVTDALNLSPVLGLSWGGNDKKLRDIVEATVPKVKGMRELKNLDCDISPVKDKRRRGWSGSKNARSFPPEVH
jgi:hypothetical protein